MDGGCGAVHKSLVLPTHVNASPGAVGGVQCSWLASAFLLDELQGGATSIQVDYKKFLHWVESGPVTKKASLPLAEAL